MSARAAARAAAGKVATNHVSIERPDTLIVSADRGILRLPRRRGDSVESFQKFNANSRSKPRMGRADGSLGRQFKIPFKTVVASVVVAWRVYSFVKRVWWRPQHGIDSQGETDSEEDVEAPPPTVRADS